MGAQRSVMQIDLELKLGELRSSLKTASNELNNFNQNSAEVKEMQ
jgi:hypothetical protein